MPDHNDPQPGCSPIKPSSEGGLQIPNTIRGRFQRLALKWLAGGIAHPYIREVRDNLDTLEGRSKVNMMLAEEVGRQALGDPLVFQIIRYH